MPMTVRLSHSYSHSADDVWHVATDLDHLKTVTSRMLTFRSLPSGKIAQGQTILVEVSMLGLLPYQPYTMCVEYLDDATRSFQSDEHGVGVKSWRHHLTVVQTADGCRIDEQIEIDAGLMTPVFAMWARIMYKSRHQPRLRILEDLS